MYRDQGFTLVELLIATAVGSIVIAGAYASFDIVAKQYEKIEDISSMHTSSRVVLRMLEKDIRMAGFEWRNNSGTKPFSPITTPFTITDSQNSCCDSIMLTYDEVNGSTATRVNITYSVARFNGRNRLSRQRDIVLPTPTVGINEPLADYIEDLQITNPDSDTDTLTGYVKLNNAGAALAPSAGSWSCIKDTSTGLTWEHKHGTTLPGNFAERYLKQLSTNEIDFNCVDPSTNSWVTDKNKCLLNNAKAHINSTQLCGFDNWRLPSTTNFATLSTLPTDFFPNIASGADYITSDAGGLAINMPVYRLKGSGTGPRSVPIREAHPIMFYTVGTSTRLLAIDLVVRSRNRYSPAKRYTKKANTRGNFNINVLDEFKRAEYSAVVNIRNP